MWWIAAAQSKMHHWRPCCSQESRKVTLLDMDSASNIYSRNIRKLLTRVRHHCHTGICSSKLDWLFFSKATERFIANIGQAIPWINLCMQTTWPIGTARLNRISLGNSLSSPRVWVGFCWSRRIGSNHYNGPMLPLQWCDNERDGVSNHRCLDYLLNRLFRRRSKKTSKLRVTGLSEGNSLVTDIYMLHKPGSARWLIAVGAYACGSGSIRFRLVCCWFGLRLWLWLWFFPYCFP